MGQQHDSTFLHPTGTQEDTTRMNARFSLYLVIGLTLLARPSAAQLRGAVRDSAGAPVADAFIEVWGASATPADVRSDRSGAFRIPADLLRGGERLSFRQWGYETRILALPVTDSILVVTLSSRPVIVEGLTAVALPARVACPQPDDPRARRVWEAVRARYSPNSPDAAYRTMMLIGVEELAQPELHDFPENRMRPRPMYWAANHDALNQTPQSLDNRVREFGYAWALPWQESWYRSYTEEFFAWNYAQLFSYRAGHFLSRTFGSLHTFSFAHDASDGTVLAFCPVGRGLPSIQGFLRISRDTSLLNARMTFRTGSPTEDAGAAVTFRTRDRQVGAAAPLLPESSTFWRRLFGTKRFTQYSYKFVSWEIGPEVRPWGAPAMQRSDR